VQHQCCHFLFSRLERASGKSPAGVPEARQYEERWHASGRFFKDLEKRILRPRIRTACRDDNDFIVPRQTQPPRRAPFTRRASPPRRAHTEGRDIGVACVFIPSSFSDPRVRHTNPSSASASYDKRMVLHAGDYNLPFSYTGLLDIPSVECYT